MESSITPEPTLMKIAVLVLRKAGLVLAHRLHAALAGETAIFGPSCIVGACGGAAEKNAINANPDALTPGSFATGEPAVFGFTGPVRLVFPALWSRFDAIVAVMPLATIVRLAGALASERRGDPAVVVVDDAGRFAVSMLDGQSAWADDLAQQVAAILGATPVVTNGSARSPGNVRRVGRR